MHRVFIQNCVWVVVPVCLAAVSCSDASLLGISAGIDEDERGARLTKIVSRAALKRTVITGTADDNLMSDRTSIGDIDGDGMDDFVVRAPWHLYLFYGAADYPERLTPSDADASFEGGRRDTVALGDINCDGLADFAVGQAEGYEIVFGDRTRLSGARPAFSSKGFALLETPPTQDYAYLQGLRPLGDIDADGCDELSVTIDGSFSERDAENRGGRFATDYVLAGRSSNWPSGRWDPSWAMAQFGDEPPAYENNGAKTIVQRLAVSGSADLDGDGHSDVLALGRSRLWLFYGSKEGLRGTLTPTQADASIVWDFKSDDRIDFASTLPIVLEDVDGDGTADIGLPNQDELGICYGSKQRWSGRVRLDPDLTIVRSMGQLLKDSVTTSWLSLEQNFILSVPEPLPLTATVRATTTDLDGDGQRELVLQEDLNPWPATPENVRRRNLYALTGPSRHATGRYVLSEMDLYPLGDVADALRSAVLFDPGGDFDGDGSADLVFGLVSNPATAKSELSLHLLAGMARAPD